MNATFYSLQLLWLMIDAKSFYNFFCFLDFLLIRKHNYMPFKVADKRLCVSHGLYYFTMFQWNDTSPPFVYFADEDFEEPRYQVACLGRACVTGCRKTEVLIFKSVSISVGPCSFFSKVTPYHFSPIIFKLLKIIRNFISEENENNDPNFDKKKSFKKGS